MALEGDNTQENHRDSFTAISGLEENSDAESVQSSRASLSLLKKSRLRRVVSQHDSGSSEAEDGRVVADGKYRNIDNDKDSVFLSPAPSITESQSSLGSGASFPDRSKMKSKLQRMVERAREEDRQRQLDLKEHRRHEEKPLFQKMLEKAAVDADKEEKVKIEDYHKAMAQKKASRVPPASSLSPLHTPVMNRGGDPISGGPYTNKNSKPQMSQYKHNANEDRERDRDRDRENIVSNSNRSLDKIERRDKSSAKKKKKLPLFMRMQEKARAQEERLEKDKLDRYQQLRMQKKINCVPTRQELRERASRYEQQLLQMQQQHYEDHLSAHAGSADDRGRGDRVKESRLHTGESNRRKEVPDGRLRPLPRRHGVPAGDDNDDENDLYSHGGRRSANNLEERPVVFNSNPPDYSSPLPGEIGGDGDRDGNGDDAMLSPLSMASAMPYSGAKAKKIRDSDRKGKRDQLVGRRKVADRGRSSSDHSYDYNTEPTDTNILLAEDTVENSKLVRAAGKEKMKRKKLEAGAEVEGKAGTCGSGKVRFHVSGDANVHHRDRHINFVHGATDESSNSPHSTVTAASNKSAPNSNTDIAIGKTKNKGMGTPSTNRNVDSGPLWLAEVLETDGSEQGLMMMYAEGFSMYMVEQGMIPE